MLPIELLESCRRGEVVLLVGAGLSVGAGLPGWADLVRPLARSVGAPWPTSEADLTVEHLLRAAQYYENQRGRHVLISHLRSALDASGISPTPVHNLIASLPVNVVFTTNYDDLIERAFRNAGRSTHVVIEKTDLPFWHEDAVQVVKLCGDLKRPTSIVITQRDFNTYFTIKSRLAERLRTVLESKTALFLGYSLRDPFFNQIWDNIALHFGDLRRWGYAVLFEATQLAADAMRYRNIHIINLEAEERDKSSVLEQWLIELSTALPVKGALPSGDRSLPPSGQVFGTGRRWAVLVGVNEYEDRTNYGRLHVCVKDVQAIHRQLVNNGFDPARIRLLTDDTPEPPTRNNILVALKAIADAAEPNDLLLFYYSGHGDESGGESYLVARDGQRLVLGDTAVPVSRVREIISQSPARAKVIILDACHSGVDIGGKGPRPMSEAFIRRVFEQAEGMAILASCKQGQLSYEWRARERSVFTHYLLESLKGQADWDSKGFVTVQDINRYVTDGVKLWAAQHNVSQTPTLQYSVAGDIVLCASVAS